MTSKTKAQFNQSNKEVYKYNFLRKPTENVNPLEMLNSIQKDADSLNDKIDEYYHVKIPLDHKRALHRIKFTINE